MKLVVLDGFTLNPGDLDWGVLGAFGPITVYPSTKDEEVVERIGDADIVFVNKTRITREMLAQCPNIRYIGELATGLTIWI